MKPDTCVQVVKGVYKALCDSKAKPKAPAGMLDQVDAATMLQKALARILPFLEKPHGAVMGGVAGPQRADGFPHL